MKQKQHLSVSSVEIPKRGEMQRKTAAFEALILCRKFYPWRVHGTMYMTPQSFYEKYIKPMVAV